MATVLYYGVFDGKLWRSEYRILHHLISAGHTIFFANYTVEKNIEAFWKVYGKEVGVVLIQNGKDFKAEYLQMFNVPVIFMATEFSVKLSGHLLNASRKPDLVLASSASVNDYCLQKKINVRKMLPAYNPSQYFSIPVDHLYDVCFLGTLTSRRIKILEKLKNSGKYNLWYGKLATPFMINNYYNQSKIVLHIHADEEKYIPSRMFEVMPTRGCLLTEDPGESISEKKFCETFENEKQMTEKIDFLLRSETSRNLLVKQANRLAPQHTWNERSKVLNAAIKEMKGK